MKKIDLRSKRELLWMSRLLESKVNSKVLKLTNALGWVVWPIPLEFVH